MVITKQIPVVDAQNVNNAYYYGKHHLITKVHQIKEEEKGLQNSQKTTKQHYVVSSYFSVITLTVNRLSSPKDMEWLNGLKTQDKTI